MSSDHSAGGAARARFDVADVPELHLRCWPPLARAHVAVRGAMLDRGCGVVLAAVERALEPGIRIVLDLSDVAAIDVAGARAIRDCCELAERAGTELSVQDPSPVVQRVLAGVP